MMSRLLTRTRVCNALFCPRNYRKIEISWVEFLWNRAFSKSAKSHKLMLLIYSVANFVAHETRKITARAQRNCITESFPKTYVWKSPQKVLSKTTKWWGVGMDITFNMNSTLLRISIAAFFSKDYFGKSWLMAIGVITMCKYWQALFASEQQKRQSHASSV